MVAYHLPEIDRLDDARRLAAGAIGRKPDALWRTTPWRSASATKLAMPKNSATKRLAA